MAALKFVDVAQIGALVLVLFVFMSARTATFPLADNSIILKIHNKAPGLSMFQLGINGRIAIARRNPTPDGKTYKIPLAKYGNVRNLSIVIYGTGITVDSIILDGKNILKAFVYAGSDLSTVMATTVPKGSHVQDGRWIQEGVYVFIP